MVRNLLNALKAFLPNLRVMNTELDLIRCAKVNICTIHTGLAGTFVYVSDDTLASMVSYGFSLKYQNYI